MNILNKLIISIVLLSGLFLPVASVLADTDLDAAFRKEFAFMENQKRVLQQRLAEQKVKAQQEQNKIAAENARIEKKLIDLENQNSRLNQRILEAERMIDSAESGQAALESTYEQANASLHDYGFGEIKKDKVFNQSTHPQKLSMIFDRANNLLSKLSSVYKEQSQYYLADGRKVDGEIIHLGNVAAYGVSPQASGALAPAGEGDFKLWSRDAADTAKSLAEGIVPAYLKAFIFESSRTAVDADQDKTLLDIIQSGGSIAWIIVALGMIALIMIILRAMFLKRSGSDAEKMLAMIRDDVSQGQLQSALAKCEHVKSAASRVVQATLRNADRDRDHIEDIISESILHESKYLNRYGAFIMVIAAVSPLLGLLGTVTGMIATFDVITQFGTGDPKLLSGGISTALVTTQLGLVVAIPALMLGNMMSSWSNRIKDDMENSALRVINLYEKSRLPEVPAKAA